MKTTLALHRDTQHELMRLSFVTEPVGKPATIDEALLEELDAACERLEREPARMVVMTSSSEKYFVVGANVEALQRLDAGTIDEWVRRGHAVLHRLSSLPMPVVAKVDGYCLGGGLEIALACDLIVASAGASLGLPEATLGLVPGWGGTARLPAKVGRSFAKRMALTGDRITAEQGERVGLVGLLVADAASAEVTVMQLARDVARLSAPAVALTKSLCNTAVLGEHWTDACEREASASIRAMQQEDTRSRLNTFFHSRRR